MSEYRLQSRVMYWLFALALPCLMVGTSVLFIWVATRPGQDRGPLWFFPLWFAAVLWGSYRSATMPHTIQIMETGDLRFVGTLRTSVIASSDVRSIKSMGTIVELKHRKGKILLLNQFTAFHEFLTELKRANPQVLIKGV
jgi:hypothetical protein